VEAIFAKTKPVMERPKLRFDEEPGEDRDYDEEEELDEKKDSYEDDDDDDFDEDKLTEESYRTTFETDPEDLSLDAAEVSDDDDDY
jgi:hypothetical protein